MNILVTGIAGFIGFHLCKYIADMTDHNLIGIDNINSYYDVNLKLLRLKILGIEVDDKTTKSVSLKYKEKLIFYKIDLCDYQSLENIFKLHNFDCVINLAAQAGVRYSLIAPFEYSKANLLGFITLLECCKLNNVNKVLYASSSSIYGNSFKNGTTKICLDKPVSLYGATKRSNEIISYCYSHLYNISLIGLRFFTVYGPWGRPDMAFFKFVNNIINNIPIKVYNNGKMSRDFTYIDDIVKGIIMILFGNEENINVIYDIGGGKTINLIDFIIEIEEALGIKAKIELCDMQPGDVYDTKSNIIPIKNKYGYNPSVSLKQGIFNFVKWYKEYYEIN